MPDTTTVVFVFWIYFSSSWAYGPVPMTAGWFAWRVLDRDACWEAAERLTADPLLFNGKTAVCLSPHAPEPVPLARVRR